MWPFKRRKKQTLGDTFDISVTTTEYEGFLQPWESNKQWKTARQKVWKHLEVQTAMQEAYARREVDGLDRAVSLCYRLIDLGPASIQAFRDDDRFLHETTWDGKKRKGKAPPFRPPTHLGFKQLAIIREREKNYPEAITLCQQAMKQGWSGDWDVRIARCRRKMSS